MSIDKKRLILVLGDQLTPKRGALAEAEPGRDVILMAEVAEEASYVRHNQHKIALIFSAMRHFCAELREAGFEVIYVPYETGVPSLYAAVMHALEQCDAAKLLCTEAGEYRLQEAIGSWSLPCDFEWVKDDGFMVDHAAFNEWADGRKTFRMEYFYREVRRKYQLLLQSDGTPEGDRWNFDAENREGWRGKAEVPEPPLLDPDTITEEVIDLVQSKFPGNPGRLEHFQFATTRQGAEKQFRWFLEYCLPSFGRFQDALAEASPWLFHARISMYLNIGLLQPLAVCRSVEEEYRAGKCDLAAAEGFIRQVAGWREYVRGMYWLQMPDYADLNRLDADAPLPDFFWTGETDMRCLSLAIGQSLDLGYAHHIQRLMVIGNFCLLTGIDIGQVCDWYLGVYVDAFEWVELPNTLGMALHADGGIMASKPYAASGKYIQRQGDHCKQCRYSPAKVTGDDACPYNSLYWRFLHKHSAQWDSNPRMKLSLRNWQRKTEEEQVAILDWAENVTAQLQG